MFKKFNKITLATVLLTIFIGPFAIADNILLTGTNTCEWMIKSSGKGDKAEFDIYSRQIGKDYMPSAEEMSGSVLAAQAIGNKLVIMPEGGGGFAIISQDGSSQTGRNQPGQLLAICDSPKNGGTKSAEIIGLFSSINPPAGLDVTKQKGSTAPWLCVYKTFGLGWKPIAAIQAKASTGLIAADATGAIYVLVEDSTGKYGLFAQWTSEHGFKGGVKASGKVLALLRVKDDVFAVSSQKAGKDQQNIFIQNISKQGKPAVIKNAKEAIAWPAETKLKFAMLGNDVAVYWQKDGKWLLRRFDAKGQARAQESLSELLQLMPDLNYIQEVSQYFAFGLIGLIFGVMFLTKPYIKTPRMLTLPKGQRPANLFKRTIAFIIDVLIVQTPVSIAMSSWIMISRGLSPEEFAEQVPKFTNPKLAEDSLSFITQYPESMFVMIALVAALAAYGTIMENRLGWTLGKKLMGLKVVTDDGIKPPLREAALRNLMKIVEIYIIFTSNPIFILVLIAIVMLINRYRQRFGDIIARTVVTEPGEMPPLPIPPFMQNPNDKNQQ